jgi:hypothetical protein
MVMGRTGLAAGGGKSPKDPSGVNYVAFALPAESQ